MNIVLSCQQCGSNNFSLDNASDDGAQVECRDCGRPIGTLGEIKARVAAQVAGRAE